ncbi:copper resistance CopC family protein [Streptosporangium subroseum]|uniref:copper resistance CopC family protein n=1 Tax=Streptosporangium subroseum TaxID=106412 RepID=UPI00308CCE77|nr:copper resistance protein CopC [Streptosporangium subroseum]
MFLRRSVILLVVLAAALWPVTAAQAHDVLKSSNPAKGSKVTDISEVSLEFERAVKFPKVAVLNASGERFQSGEASLRGKKVVQTLSGTLPPGKYTIGFRVVSSDGHPRTGEIPFTVIASSTPTPTPTSSSSATVSEAPGTPAPSSAAPSAQPVEPTLIPQANETGGSASGGSSMFLWVVVGLIAVMAAFSIVISRRRRSGT